MYIITKNITIVTIYVENVKFITEVKNDFLNMKKLKKNY